MQHGQIYKMEMYPSGLKSSWAFVECNAAGDSQIIIGRSRAPEGRFHDSQIDDRHSIDEDSNWVFHLLYISSPMDFEHQERRFDALMV
jgi:hypothetical protein